MKTRKFAYLRVLQGRGAGSPGWEDLDTVDRSDRSVPQGYLRAQVREWRAAWPGAELRIVGRRVRT